MSELRRSLSLPMLVFYGTGVILGAGVYSVIGKAAGPADDTLWISFLIASVSAILIFSFFGFENIANLSEEAINPKRDIPRAIFISLGISTVLYILVALAALSLVEPEVLVRSEAPLMLVAQTVSNRFGVILGVVALFSTANTALISMIGASRIIFGMAEAKALPKLLAKVLSSRKTPWLASLIVLTAALALDLPLV